MSQFQNPLLTSPVFLAEHDSLLSAERAKIRRFGFPRPVLYQSGSIGPSAYSTVQANDSARQFADFCGRWRLQSLAAEFLPLPLEPQLPGAAPVSGMAAAPGITSVMHLDIYPIAGRGELPAILEDAVRGSPPPEHLRDWIDIVRAANPARNQIGRYARLFQFQHFWRVLYSRHASALDRKKTHLTAILAEYFVVTEDVIRRDLRFLDARLGGDWRLRPSPLD